MLIRWAVKDGWGYHVEVVVDDAVVEVVENGDAYTDPRRFGTGQIRDMELRELALYTVSLLKKQHRKPCTVVEDKSIIK